MPMLSAVNVPPALVLPDAVRADRVASVDCACAGAGANSESAPSSSASVRDANVPRLCITKSDFSGGGGKLVLGQFPVMRESLHGTNSPLIADLRC